MTKISAGYNIDSPEISNLISNGVCEILYNGADPIEVTTELGNVLRSVLRLRAFTPKAVRKNLQDKEREVVCSGAAGEFSAV